MTTSKDNKRFVDIPDEIRTDIGTYSIENKIGVGGNAVVHECTDLFGNVGAIKFLLNVSKKNNQRFSQEISLLQNLDHAHIIKYIDSGHVVGKESKNGKEINIPFVVMEKADYNIVEYMKKMDRSVTYEMYAPQIRGLSDALRLLHEKAVHRDIKPENILVRGETWLLSDFGLCTALDEDERIDVTKTQERIGPKYWLSPEATDRVYFGINEINEASDVYQLCAVFWFIITKRYPLGIIELDDYSAFDCHICEELLKAMTYDRNKRTPNGLSLYENICKITINRDN